MLRPYIEYACIIFFQCLECEGLFCPQKFVCHSHDPKNRTCHWGFDSDNWRAYLHLAEDYTDTEREKMSKIVADFKNRYKPTSATTLTSKRKTVRHLIFLLYISLLIPAKNKNGSTSRVISIYRSCRKCFQIMYFLSNKE